MHMGASWDCDPHGGGRAGTASAAATPGKGTEQPAFLAAQD